MATARTIELPTSPLQRPRTMRWREGHSPGDVLRYTLDARRWLAQSGDVVTALSVGAAPNGIGDLVVSGATFSPDGVCSAVLAGGSDGTDYAVTFSVTLASGQVLSRQIWVLCEHLSPYSSEGELIVGMVPAVASPLVVNAGTVTLPDPSSLSVTPTGSAAPRSLAQIGARALGLTGIDVALRPPTPADDGYAVGALWQAGGRVWSAVDTTPGAALWIPVTGAAMLPGDAVPGAVGIFGTIRLVAAYGSGPALDVVRDSDGASKTINFLPGPDGALDEATLAAFCAGTVGRMSKQYNQDGSANHVVMTVAANRPIIWSQGYSGQPVARIGMALSVVFDIEGHFGSYGTAAQSLVIPSGISVGMNSSSAFMMARAPASLRPTSFFTLGPGTPHVEMSSGIAYGTQVLLDASSGPAVQTGILPRLTPFIVGYTASSTATVAYAAGTATTAGPNGAAAMSGGAINQAAGSSKDLEYAGFMIYPSGLSAAQAALLQSSMHRAFGTVPQARSVLFVEGDSISQGYGQSAGQGYVRQAVDMLGTSVVAYNGGLAGSLISVHVTAFPTNVAPYLPAQARSVVLVFCGTNDMANGASPATVYASITAEVAQIHAAGALAAVATMLPRGDNLSLFQANQPPFNALVKANLAGADAIVNFDANAIMNSFAGLSNAANYEPDEIHPAPAGHAMLAGQVASAINALFKR